MLRARNDKTPRRNEQKQQRKYGTGAKLQNTGKKRTMKRKRENEAEKTNSSFSTRGSKLLRYEFERRSS